MDPSEVKPFYAKVTEGETNEDRKNFYTEPCTLLLFIMQRIHLIISGDVQGVGFRSWALHQAQAKQLTGWVKNRSDGSVEIVAEGESEVLDEFTGLCRNGPDTGWVDRVTVSQLRATGEFKGFAVVY